LHRTWKRAQKEAKAAYEAGGQTENDQQHELEPEPEPEPEPELEPEPEPEPETETLVAENAHTTIPEGAPPRAEAAKSKDRRGQKDKKHKKHKKHTKGAKPVKPQAQLSDLFGSSSEDDDADMGANKVNTKDLFESDSEDINLFGGT
jgi:hypothetical protein